MDKIEQDKILEDFGKKYALGKLKVGLDFLSLEHHLSDYNNDKIGTLNFDKSEILFDDECGEPYCDYTADDLRSALEELEQSDEFKMVLAERAILKEFAEKHGFKSIRIFNSFLPYSIIDTSDGISMWFCDLTFDKIPAKENSFVPEAVRKYTAEELEATLSELEQTKAFQLRLILHNFAKKHGLRRVSFRGECLKISYSNKSKSIIDGKARCFNVGRKMDSNIGYDELKCLLEEFEKSETFKSFKAEFVEMNLGGVLRRVIVEEESQ
ncbi:hypothetical protein FACS189499_07720 [Clostridia bacterium]|nr:hypothetical protein FACS189499_07720 [Clostridia bacterium]